MAQNLPLERGQRRFERGAGVRGRSDAAAVVAYRELCHLTLAMAVIEDEQRQAGVAQQAPGLCRAART